MRKLTLIDMPKHLLCLVCILAINFISNSKTQESFSKTFNLNDFNIEINESGETEITSLSYDAYYGDEFMPTLPVIDVQYAIPYNMQVDSVSYSRNRKVVSSKIVLCANPQISPMDVPVNSNVAAAKQSYALQKYPTSICELSQVTPWDGVNVAHFMVSPFEYDAARKILYFNSQVTIHLTMSEKTDGASRTRLGTTGTVSSLIKSEVENSTKVDAYIAASSLNSQGSYKIIADKDKVEYLIITSSDLVSSFEPLRRWRERTGLKSKTVTTEEIYRSSNQSTNQLKIKSYIRNLYQNNGLIYVLLGGDDTIVPTQYCYAKVKSSSGEQIENQMPSDGFYADTENCLDWDTNKNGLIGEMDDKIVSSASVIVSRLPARTKDDVDAMVKKTIDYECKPNWKNRILLAGTKATTNPSDKQNDTELQTRKIYRAYAKPFWQCDTNYFFHSYTTYPEGDKFDVTSTNFQKVMGEGHDYISMLCHGSFDRWQMESGESYSSRYGNALKSPVGNIIFTGACNTNAFDKSETDYPYGSLSESLLRNPDSGTVAYFGCSRLSWGNIGVAKPGANLTCSFSPLFKTLYPTTDNPCKRWGEACTKAKSSINFTMDKDYYHWHWLGFNPMGDPAMPMYTQTPEEFPDDIISCTTSGIEISVNTYEVTTCVMNLNQDSPEFYSVAAGGQSFHASQMPMRGSVVISKRNYIPKSYSYSFIQNTTFTSDETIKGNNVWIGRNVTQGQEEGDVVCRDGKTTVYGGEIVFDKGFCVEKGAELECLPFNEMDL